MGENLSRRFATMTEEERRRFELEMEQARSARETDEADQELEFGEPRRDHSAMPAEVADRDDVDTPGEDEIHARRTRKRGPNQRNQS
jgi:hypothetical protein